jgi:hypothetical protein
MRARTSLAAATVVAGGVVIGWLATSNPVITPASAQDKPDVPAKQFWAVTLYDRETCGFIREMPRAGLDSYD